MKQIFENQLQAYKAIPGRSLDERYGANNADAIKTVLLADFKKTATEVELGEIGPSIGEIDFALANLNHWISNHLVKLH